jgi:hypothetical protein
MDYCPNCSAQLAEDALECHNCGAQFQPRSQPESGQPGQEPGQHGAKQPRQPNAGQTAEQGQQPPRQHGAQRPPGQTPPPGQDQQQDKIGPLTRRQALAVGGGLAVMVGAWALGFGNSAEESPESVVTEYVNAVEARDADAASTLVHQDSPDTDALINPANSQQPSGENTEYTLTVEETTVLGSETATDTAGVQEFATVETTVTTALKAESETESRTQTVQFRVAKNSAGTWKLWSVSAGTSTVDDSPPAVNFEFEYAPGSSGPGDGRLTITHVSGETIEASELFVRGSGVNRVGNDPTSEFSQRFDRISATLDSSSSVTAGVSVELEADSDYEVSVVWEGNPASTLGQASGPDA